MPKAHNLSACSGQLNLVPEKLCLSCMQKASPLSLLQPATALLNDHIEETAIKCAEQWIQTAKCILANFVSSAQQGKIALHDTQMKHRGQAKLAVGRITMSDFPAHWLILWRCSQENSANGLHEAS